MISLRLALSTSFIFWYNRCYWLRIGKRFFLLINWEDERNINSRHAQYIFQWKRRCLVYQNITGYLKNHWTKHRLVCTYFDAFSMLIPNMSTTCDNSEHFLKTNQDVVCIYHTVDWRELLRVWPWPRPSVDLSRSAYTMLMLSQKEYW